MDVQPSLLPSVTSPISHNANDSSHPLFEETLYSKENRISFSQLRFQHNRPSYAVIVAFLWVVLKVASFWQAYKKVNADISHNLETF